MKRLSTLILCTAVLVGAGLAAPAFAQSSPAPAAAPARLVNEDVAAPKTLKVTSSAYADGGAIPQDYSSYGASRSPDLAIAGAPRKTKSFVILMEDADAQRDGQPILHWFAYGLSAKTPALPAAIPAGAEITSPVALKQAPNIAGQNAYRGPRPPKGAHRYHLEVFALDIDPTGLTDRASLRQAMAGHVLAQGELVGVFSAPPPAN